MDHTLSAFVNVRRLIALWALAALSFCMAAGSHAASMPAIQPIAVSPIGPAPGNGVATQVTYQIGGSAVNDAGVASAANEASYVTRGVTMSGPTMGGIVRGGLAGASRFLGWVGAAITAYQIYKWYTDQSGNLMQPGQSVPSYNCGGGDYWTVDIGGTACSLPGVAALVYRYQNAAVSGMPASALWPTCSNNDGNASCVSVIVPADGSANFTHVNSASFAHNAPPSTVDIAYTTPASAVTNDQLAGLANQHPEWWPQMFTDPQTGNVVVNPDIANDMTQLQQQLAPKYGVDPTTLTPVQPDPNYGTQVGSPKQTDLPQYCAWASAACDYYQFVEKNWPKQGQYTDEGCNTVPPCSGDQVMCGVALNTWYAKCGIAGDGSEPPKSGQHVVSELDQPDQTVGDASQLDTTGFGFGTQCPFQSQDVPFGDSGYHMDVGPVCEYGPWLRYILLGFCAWKCGEIVAGLRSNK